MLTLCNNHVLQGFFIFGLVYRHSVTLFPNIFLSYLKINTLNSSPSIVLFFVSFTFLNFSFLSPPNGTDVYYPVSTSWSCICWVCRSWRHAPEPGPGCFVGLDLPSGWLPGRAPPVGPPIPETVPHGRDPHKSGDYILVWKLFPLPPIRKSIYFSSSISDPHPECGSGFLPISCENQNLLQAYDWPFMKKNFFFLLYLSIFTYRCSYMFNYKTNLMVIT